MLTTPNRAVQTDGDRGERTVADDDTERDLADDDVTDRDEMLSLMEDAIREAHRKVQSGRVKSESKEKVRIQWVRALSYSVGQYRKLIKDRDLEEMNERLEALEEAQR
jgi:hypothetical protein